MKCIKGFLQKIDVFGVSYSFKHKKSEKYNTSLGGFIFLLFIVVVIIFGIYYFIPFYNIKNFSIIYYSMNMPVTDTIKLSESKASFAIGLECPFEEKTQVSGKDLFDLQLTYIVYSKDHNGNRNKVKNILSSHKCTYADFYNNYNDSFDFAGLNQFECLDKKDNSIQGIFADEVFSYYEFTVMSKNNSVDLFQKIDRYLTEQDCKLQLYYTDITIDFDDYKEPIKPYINSVFIQLNPTLFLKMNVFFKNTHTLFSRLEEYSLYKGLDRGTVLPKDNAKYANIYIRADTSKTTIKRKYQKVMEFYADSSSLMIALFEVLYIIFCFFNRFYADHSLSKQIFFFKEVENKHFDINRKSNQIKNLIRLLEPLTKKKIIPLSIKDNKNKSPRINEDNNEMDINDLEEGINIYKMNKNISKKESFSKFDEIYKPKKMRNGFNLKIRFSKNEEYEENNKNLNTIQSTKRNVINRYKVQPVKISNMTFKSLKEIEQEKIGRIKYKYNIFEILWSYLGTCCMTNKLKSKNNLTQKSDNILNEKLDISLYIKNTILIDILNQALINDNMKSMIKFISRPIISINKNVKRDMNQFYKNYELTDFNNLYEDVSEMSKKPRLTPAEQKIISFVYNELNEMV